MLRSSSRSTITPSTQACYFMVAQWPVTGIRQRTWNKCEIYKGGHYISKVVVSFHLKLWNNCSGGTIISGIQIFRDSACGPIAMATFSVEVMVCGYHVYQGVWTPIVGEELSCRKEYGNTQDPFAVAVLHGTTTVGHVLKKISSICSMFL